MRIDEDISISITNEYGPLVGNKTNDLFTVLSANIGFMKDLGLSGQNKYLGYQIWKKSDPMETNFTGMLFVDEKHSSRSLINMTKELMRRVVPTESSKIPGNLIPPGPSLKTLFDKLKDAGEVPASGTTSSSSSLTESSPAPTKADLERKKIELWQSLYEKEFATAKETDYRRKALARLLTYEQLENFAFVSSTMYYSSVEAQLGVAGLKALEKYRDERGKIDEAAKASAENAQNWLKAIAGYESNSGDVWVYMGGFLKFMSVVITKVQPVFSSITDDTGPVSVQLQIEFKGIVTATHLEVQNMFIYPHSLRTPGVTLD
jgi:hypothetical protein